MFFFHVGKKDLFTLEKQWLYVMENNVCYLFQCFAKLICCAQTFRKEDLWPNVFTVCTLRHRISIVWWQGAYSFQNILGSSQWAQLLVFLYRYISLVQIESLLLQAMGKRSIIPAAPDVGSSPLKKQRVIEEDSDIPTAAQLRAVFAGNDDTNEMRKKAILKTCIVTWINFVWMHLVLDGWSSTR